MNRRVNVRQFDVLKWIAAGCREGHWPAGDVSYKRTSVALQDRGLVTLHGRGPNWAASITDAGKHYLEHGTYPPSAAPRPVRLAPQRPAEPVPPDPAPLPNLSDEEVSRIAFAIENLLWRRINPPVPEVLTVDEVADSLKVGREFIHAELRRRYLRGYKLPGKAGWRIETKDLERYVAARANISRVRGH